MRIMRALTRCLICTQDGLEMVDALIKYMDSSLNYGQQFIILEGFKLFFNNSDIVLMLNKRLINTNSVRKNRFKL